MGHSAGVQPQTRVLETTLSPTWQRVRMKKPFSIPAVSWQFSTTRIPHLGLDPFLPLPAQDVTPPADGVRTIHNEYETGLADPIDQGPARAVLLQTWTN